MKINTKDESKRYKRKEATKPKALNVIGIDAGNEKSAMVLYNPRRHRVVDKIHAKNDLCLKWLKRLSNKSNVCAIEQIKSYGNVMGDSILDTCVWNGRFAQAFDSSVFWIPRKTVCGVLCHNGRAKDKNIRQAVIDLFPATGGGATPQIGTKGNRGPLYGITADLWSALAVALTAHYKVSGLLGVSIYD